MYGKKGANSDLVIIEKKINRLKNIWNKRTPNWVICFELWKDCYLKEVCKQFIF